jgi:hypothetical protein
VINNFNGLGATLKQYTLKFLVSLSFFLWPGATGRPASAAR